MKERMVHTYHTYHTYNITFYGRLTGRETCLLKWYKRASHTMIDFGGNVNGHHIQW